MKKLLLTTSTIFGLATSVALAEDFENTTVETVVYADNLQFAVSGDNNDGINAASAGITFMPYQLSTVNANLYAELEYGFFTDDFTVTGEYQMNRSFAFGDVYGAASTEYTAHEDNFDDGEWTLSPYAGVTYILNDNITTFAEVGYSWNMSQNWDKVGGYGEIGVDFSINENITLKPSIFDTFDTAYDSTQMNLTMVFQF